MHNSEIKIKTKVNIKGIGRKKEKGLEERVSSIRSELCDNIFMDILKKKWILSKNIANI